MIKNNHTFAILAYKESPFIEECILSLKSQNYSSEIFISTSTPSSFLSALSKKYKIPLLINNNKIDIASDWSFAYKKCKTKYLTLCHQDDLYFPEYTRACVDSMEKNINSLIGFTNYYEIDDNKKMFVSANILVKRIIIKIFFQSPGIFNKTIKKMFLSFGNPICCPSVIFNKELIGDFIFPGNFSMNLDWAAWIILAERNGGFVYNREKLIARRIHIDAESAKGIVNNKRFIEDNQIFYNLWPKPFSLILSSLYSLSRKPIK